MNDEINIQIGTAGHKSFFINFKPHTFAIGQTGVGKSTFLTNSFLALLREGEYGGIFVDPHGTAIDKISRFIPRERMNDVIYLDPLADRVPGIIPQYATKDEEELYIALFMSLLKSIFRNAWGDETERIIMGAVSAVTESYGFLNIPAIYLFIARESFRKDILAKCKNPLLADFAEQYDEKLRSSEQMSKFSPPLNKIDGFVAPIMRPLVSQEKPIDFLRAMNERKIILVDVSKGKLGAENAQLIGSIILGNISIAALRRKPSDPQFFVFVDEVQNFLHGVDFETFLAELRKYNVSLCIASQYLENFPSLSALFGNCQNGIVYRVSGQDAQQIEDNYLDQGAAKLIVGLPNYQFISYRIENDVPVPSPVIKSRNKIKKLGDEPPRGAVIAESLRRYGADRKATDEKMLKFLTPKVGSPRPSASRTKPRVRR
jgi:DNA helicase HerA-like ATPase